MTADTTRREHSGSGIRLGIGSCPGIAKILPAGIRGITLVSIITLVDQFHLAARSARMLPMRSSSAPIRQHLQSAIQQTQENRPLFRLFPLEMDTTAYRIMHHSRP